MNKEIIQSKNKGLFNNLIEEIKQYDFKLIVKANYNNGLMFSCFVYPKDWKEVYLK